jgi:hypothetical protein
MLCVSNKYSLPPLVAKCVEYQTVEILRVVVLDEKCPIESCNK